MINLQLHFIKLEIYSDPHLELCDSFREMIRNVPTISGQSVVVFGMSSGGIF